MVKLDHAIRGVIYLSFKGIKVGPYHEVWSHVMIMLSWSVIPHLQLVKVAWGYWHWVFLFFLFIVVVWTKVPPPIWGSNPRFQSKVPIQGSNLRFQLMVLICGSIPLQCHDFWWFNIVAKSIHRFVFTGCYTYSSQFCINVRLLYQNLNLCLQVYILKVKIRWPQRPS